MTAWRSLKPKEWEEHTRKWKAARGKNAFYHLKAWVIFFCLVGWVKLNFPNQKAKINFEKSNQTSVRELKMEKEKIWQIKHPVNLASVERVVVSSTNTMLSSNISALICLRDLLEFRLILKKLLWCTEKYIWSQCDKGDTVNTQWCSNSVLQSGKWVFPAFSVQRTIAPRYATYLHLSAFFIVLSLTGIPFVPMRKDRVIILLPCLFSALCILKSSLS